MILEKRAVILPNCPPAVLNMQQSGDLLITGTAKAHETQVFPPLLGLPGIEIGER